MTKAKKFITIKLTKREAKELAINLGAQSSIDYESFFKTALLSKEYGLKKHDPLHLFNIFIRLDDLIRGVK